MSAWPEVRTVAHLKWGVSRVPGRVIRLSDDLLTVAMVLPRGTNPLPPPGGAVEVQWSNHVGLHERSTVLERHKAGLVHLSPAGPAHSRQRRQFFRAPVTIDLRVSDGTRHLDGVTIDLSEGGARATVQGEPLLPSTPVTTTLRFDNATHEIPSTVVRHIPRGHRGELGLAFDRVPKPTATKIRHHVFTAQVEARRNGQLL